MNIIYRLDQDPDRPTQVTYAVLLLYALLTLEIALFLIQNIVFYITYSEQIRLGSILFQLFFFALGTLLMFLVARKIADGKNWARWLLLIGFIFIVIASLCNIQMILNGDAIAGISILSQVFITGMAVTLLFQPSSSRWFSPKKRVIGRVDLSNDSEVVVYRSWTENLSNLKNRVNSRYLSLFDTKPKSILAATMMYGIVGAIAFWLPFYLLIVRALPTYDKNKMSCQDQLELAAIGAFMAIIISLPFTYFRVSRFSKSRAFWIGFVVLMVSFLLASIAGM